jgi:hypothetical protein
MNNAIMVLQPYWASGTWVFDDASVGLVREPFVAGIPEIITEMVKQAGLDLKKARKGFRLLFSAEAFPACHQFTWLREEFGGNWYRHGLTGREGWLCPALFKYFSKAPRALYAKAEPL